jgi:Nucleotide-diphospho-sugar transferase
MQAGFIDSIRRKVDLILRAIDECQGYAFAIADVDVQFFGPFAGELQEMIAGYDLVAQVESPAGDLCAGFFACHANPRMRKLWQAVRDRLGQHPGEYEQLLMDRFCMRGLCRWRGLPPTCFGDGTLTGMLWRPGDTLCVPPGIRVHHANYCVGVEHKIAQLRYVRDMAG